MPVIYDVGMHAGDDTDYYLTKGADVVAVEADPDLCAAAAERFAPFVEAGRLTIVNAAIAEREGRATFYRHREVSEWNTLVPPTKEPEKWDPIEVSTMPLHQLVRDHPDTEFVKIDIEGYDFHALDSLDRADHAPRHVSCEAHAVRIPAKLIAMGYTQFRLVNCKLQRKQLRRMVIKRLDGRQEQFRFSRECSGPYGDDLPGEWLDADQLMYLWAGRLTMLGRGWYDVHARREP
jgi:FkbM family methyltransferase